MIERYWAAGQLKRMIPPAVGFVMTSAQEHKLVAALSLLILRCTFRQRRTCSAPIFPINRRHRSRAPVS
jgi:hypothetical protein